MLDIAKKGKGAMPPKGTCMQCSDEELRKTIEYMIPQKK
ncbi:MAG: c-type cytochrome [Candidatus Berkiellales bacterium]